MIALAELSFVRLTRQIDDFPTGTVGTVVHAYPSGAAYEVEFNLAYTGEPEEDWRHRVITVEADDLEAVND